MFEGEEELIKQVSVDSKTLGDYYVSGNYEKDNRKDLAIIFLSNDNCYYDRQARLKELKIKSFESVKKTGLYDLLKNDAERLRLVSAKISDCFINGEKSSKTVTSLESERSELVSGMVEKAESYLKFQNALDEFEKASKDSLFKSKYVTFAQSCDNYAHWVEALKWESERASFEGRVLVPQDYSSAQAWKAWARSFKPPSKFLDFLKYRCAVNLAYLINTLSWFGVSDEDLLSQIQALETWGKLSDDERVKIISKAFGKPV